MSSQNDSSPASVSAGGRGFSSSRRDIRSLDREELADFLKTSGEPGYRLQQVVAWVHEARAESWDQMTSLPRTLRTRLAEAFDLHPMPAVRVQGSRDTTRKFLWRLRDGAMIESVLIPANPALYGEASDRHTLCVSTQVGCAYGCRFCASGLEGWRRNLGPDEIVGQVYAVENLHVAEVRQAGEESAGNPGATGGDSRLVNNLVIMGMGEPLANYDNLLKALRILNAAWGLGIGARKITVSTSGLVPQIRKLSGEPEQFRLAISLHGATDEVRNRIMPVNKKYPLRDLADACAEYRDRKGRMITLEYILLEGVNDGSDQVLPLSKLAGRLGAKVNLIPYNQVDGLEWNRPSQEVQEKFLSDLQALGVQATLRREKGHDIDAACGQLRLRTEREEQANGGVAESENRATKS